MYVGTGSVCQGLAGWEVSSVSRSSRICRWGEERGAFWGGVAVGLVAYRGTHNATMRFTTLQNMSVSMLGRIRVRRSTTEPVEGVRER